MTKTDPSKSHLHARNRMHWAAGKQASFTPPKRTHAHPELSMIDGKRHKGQQSAGLHLDRTRVLLHHLDLEMELTQSDLFHSHCNIQYRSANVLKGQSLNGFPVSPSLFNLRFVIHHHDLTVSNFLSPSIWRRDPMWMWMTRAFILSPFADQHSRQCEGISPWKAPLRGKW